MTEPMQVGKIEQLTLQPRELTFVEIQEKMHKRAMQNPIERAKEEGRREQFQIDCEAECTACGKPEKYRPALWVENDNTYQHEVIATGKMEHCDATLLYMYWADTHKDK